MTKKETAIIIENVKSAKNSVVYAEVTYGFYSEEAKSARESFHALDDLAVELGLKNYTDL